MKNKFLISILACCMICFASIRSIACDFSSFSLVSSAYLGSNQYSWTVEYCIGGGQTAGCCWGASQNTYYWSILLGGGATFATYPATLTSPNTDSVYIGDLTVYGNSELLYIYDLSVPGNPYGAAWSCIDLSCGLADSYCITFTYTTNGFPTTMSLMGAEGHPKIPASGCNPDADMTITNSCGNGKFYVCHSGVTKCVKSNQLNTHFNHGDSPGKCVAPRLGNWLVGEESWIEVAPNPVSSYTSVSFLLTESANVEIEIFNISGQLVLSENFGLAKAGMENILDVDVSEWNAGLYFVRLVTESGTSMSSKLLKE